MLETLGEKVLIFDGAMGSELERLHLSGIPEDLNITQPEAIQKIHQSYGMADLITTNTFGLNPLKYHGAYPLEEVARAAIENARTAGKPVFFDIGPSGKMMVPMGELSFDEAYLAFKEVVLASRDLADGYIVETFSDLYELKACILAIKENSSLPVFATMTFDASGRTLSGTSVEIMANTLGALGVDALGINCSLGPHELLPLVERLVSCTDVPILVQPNRGLPVIVEGKTQYTLGAKEFARDLESMVRMGVSIIGGCCGTTPEFIEALLFLQDQPVVKVDVKEKTMINSATDLCIMEGVRVCGERLNPTGKKKVKEALINQDYTFLLEEALRQQQAGADLLDVNLGLPQIDEVCLMPEIITRLQTICDLPLQIDSSNPKAIEAGCRYYNGVPLINSVNGEASSMKAIFPIAKKYGAVVLGLCMDEKGIPSSARERVEIAKRILETAKTYGIGPERIMIDTLVVTASAQQELVKETLKALSRIHEMKIKSALGVSNVSFGLPYRPLLNRTFLAMALECGLTMPILNPLDASMMETIEAFKVLNGLDPMAKDYIDHFQDYKGQNQQAYQRKVSAAKDISSLQDAIYHGLEEKSEELTKLELETKEPLEIVNTVLVPLLDQIGKEYEENRIYLPQLIASAQAAKKAFALVSQKLPASDFKKGRVILATVEGDVHDIGKNIVKVLLESYGFEVVDLGKDVSVSEVVKQAKRQEADAIGLSALMTTTVPSMEKTIQALKQEGIQTPVFVGGAVLNPEIAERIGADYYTKDGLEMVRKLETLLLKEEPYADRH